MISFLKAVPFDSPSPEAYLQKRYAIIAQAQAEDPKLEAVVLPRDEWDRFTIRLAEAEQALRDLETQRRTLWHALCEILLKGRAYNDGGANVRVLSLGPTSQSPTFVVTNHDLAMLSTRPTERDSFFKGPFFAFLQKAYEQRRTV